MRGWINDSLRRRIAVPVTVLLLVVAAGISLVSYLQLLRVTRELRADRLRQLGEQLTPLLSRGPDSVVARLARAARDSSVVRFVASGGQAGRDRVLALLRSPGELRHGNRLLDAQGKVLLEVFPDTVSGFNPPVVAADLDPQAGAAIGPHRQFNDSVLYNDAHAPVLQGDRLIGTLVRRTRSPLSGESRRTFLVLLGTGTDLAVGSPSTGIWTDLASIIPPPPGEALGASAVTRFDWQGREVLGLLLPIERTPWQLAVRTDYSVITAPAQAHLRRAAIVALLFVLFGTIAAVGLGRRLGRPIEEITELTEQIASGEESRPAREDSPGEVGRLGRAFNAMVERVAASTRRLRESEASHRAFVAHASEGIWRIEFVPPINTRLSRDLQIDSWYRMAPTVEGNAALARMHGVAANGDVAAIPLAELFPPQDPASRTLFTGFIEGGYRSTGVESRLTHDQETTRIFVNDLIGNLENGGLRRIWGIRRDVTIERLLDERLAQTQRLEAIGRLAGGIAHDFNNLLTAVLGYVDSLQERLPAGSPARADAEEVGRLALRASELTRQLLAFGRGQVLRPAALDLNSVVRSTEGLLRRVIGEDIELKLQLTEPLPTVDADAGQLERVLMNLALNARDAMPRGGLLELRTAPIELDEEYARMRPGVLPGRYVMLAVSDTGIGMREEIQRHVFEPFFTTKPPGQGTGLGLSTAYGIVRQSGGDITLYSEVGKGTTFKVFLPARSRRAAPAEPVLLGGPAGEPGGGGHETVLLVEDEAPVREVVRRALTAAGYAVIVARDAAEALRLGDAQLASVDLVLTDMILPGMSGRDLVTQLASRRSDLRVIVMSGYTGETYPALEALPAGVGYLEKPFSLVDLRRKVREALDR